MQITLLSGIGRDWLVMGSNGAIGSELTKALQHSQLIDAGQPPIIQSHPWDLYGSAAVDVLRTRSTDRQISLLFCCGKGGFSLPQSSADLQHRAFSEFCDQLRSWSRLDRFIFVSSLGAHCSRVASPYSQLIRANENCLQQAFDQRALILRLPSIYGYNYDAYRYHGLVGVMLMNLCLRRPTSIYARMETRRNYLSISRVARTLVADRPGGAWLEVGGLLNIQASISLSIFDICSCFSAAFVSAQSCVFFHILL